VSFRIGDRVRHRHHNWGVGVVIEEGQETFEPIDVYYCVLWVDGPPSAPTTWHRGMWLRLVDG
jgi:hypothetical protein